MRNSNQNTPRNKQNTFENFTFSPSRDQLMSSLCLSTQNSNKTQQDFSIQNNQDSQDQNVKIGFNGEVIMVTLNLEQYFKNKSNSKNNRYQQNKITKTHNLPKKSYQDNNHLTQNIANQQNLQKWLRKEKTSQNLKNSQIIKQKQQQKQGIQMFQNMCIQQEIIKQNTSNNIINFEDININTQILNNNINKNSKQQKNINIKKIQNELYCKNKSFNLKTKYISDWDDSDNDNDNEKEEENKIKYNQKQQYFNQQNRGSKQYLDYYEGFDFLGSD